MIQVLTKVVLDREIRSTYELLITCTAAVGTDATSLTGSADLLVFVGDVNDNAPRFRSRVHVAQVTENQPIGTMVTLVEATDADEGQNARVEYRLWSSDGDFRLDATTGLLTTNRKFYREQQETVEVIVMAVDSGFPQLMTTAAIYVEILDEVNEVAN